jgi:hypothetical protein
MVAHRAASSNVGTLFAMQKRAVLLQRLASYAQQRGRADLRLEKLLEFCNLVENRVLAHSAFPSVAREAEFEALMVRHSSPPFLDALSFPPHLHLIYLKLMGLSYFVGSISGGEAGASTCRLGDETRGDAVAVKEPAHVEAGYWEGNGRRAGGKERVGDAAGAAPFNQSNKRQHHAT